MCFQPSQSRACGEVSVPHLESESSEPHMSPGIQGPPPPPPTAHLAPIRTGTPDQLPLIAGTCMLGLEVCSLWGHLDSEMGRSWCQSSRPPPALLVIPPAQRLHRWVSLNPVNAPRIQGGTPSPESQHRLQRSRLP